jgi:hypothetical protein
MIYLAIFFAAVVLLLGGYVYILLPRAKYGGWANVIFATLLILSYGSFAELLGRAKPITLSVFGDDSIQLISATWVEGEAIWLWVQEDEPRAYVLPWSEEEVRQLMGAMEKAEQGTGDIIVEGLFDLSREGERTYYPTPQEKYPEKTEIPLYE